MSWKDVKPWYAGEADYVREFANKELRKLDHLESDMLSMMTTTQNGIDDYIEGEDRKQYFSKELSEKYKLFEKFIYNLQNTWRVIRGAASPPCDSIEPEDLETDNERKICPCCGNRLIETDTDYNCCECYWFTNKKKEENKWRLKRSRRV